jgi:hypothetical protein
VRRRLVDKLPEPTLRRLKRISHGESPRLDRPVGRHARRGAVPEIVAEYDAHAVRADGLAAAGAALDKAGIPYVLIPGIRQLAVDSADREATLAAVETLTSGPGWAVEPRVRGARQTGTGTLRLYRVLAAPTGHLLCGDEPTCELTFWSRTTRGDLPRADGNTHTPGTRRAPDRSQVVRYFTEAAWQRAVQSPLHWPIDDPKPDVFDVREPIDLVYTWVDGNDPDWQQRKARYAPSGETHNYSATGLSRFANRDELRYSLRSVAMYASWVRNIYIVTDRQVPGWLDLGHPQIRVIDHRDIFSDPGVLPVFNSHAIESQLHHIEGLAERYVYVNDDMFLGRPAEPEMFFHGNGIAKFFLSKQPLDLDPPSVHDLPVMSAAKNNRALIEHDFDVTIRRKMTHGMYPQLRSVLVEMEERYPDMFARVSASRFRHPDDNSIVSALQQYYAYLTGRALPADVRYRYQDISRPNTPRRLDEILRDRPQVFCLNDMDSDERQLDAQHLALRQFFSEYFPLPSPYEKA